jgi:signal transduction histidine kinase
MATSWSQTGSFPFQDWLNHLPVGTSLWELSTNEGALPHFCLANSQWEKETNHATTLLQLNEHWVFSTPKETTLLAWWQSVGKQPLVASVTVASLRDETTVTTLETSMLRQYKVTLSTFSVGNKAKGYAVLSLAPFCEDDTLGQAHHEFLSVLSHEFRTPLTSIQGFADTLLQFGNKLPEQQHRRCLTLIADQTKRLNRMVENLLSASKLAAQPEGTHQAKPVVLHLMLQKVLQTIAGKGHQPHEITIQLPPSMPPLWGNPDMLEQVLLNLIDNAFKYSPANSTITLAAELAAHPDQSQVRLTIQDEGIGMTPQQQEQLFTKFYRASNPLTQNVEGTGLGLYITKVLVQQLEGTIAVAHSVPNQGTCFELMLPLATTQRIQQKTPLLLASPTEANTHA